MSDTARGFTTIPDPGTTFGDLCAGANLIAHWANLRYVEEAAIRDHILQSLISHPKLYDRQVDVLTILFKLAGATFKAYADPTVFDRCFELLKGHNYNPPWPKNHQNYREYLNLRKALIQVSALHVAKRGRRAKEYFQVVALRERGWDGLPSPLYSSRPGDQTPQRRTRKTPLQPLLLRPSDFLTEISNLRSLSLFHPNRSPPPRRAQFSIPPSLPSLSLHPSASPLCPTSPPQVLLMTNLPLTPPSRILLTTNLSSTPRL